MINSTGFFFFSSRRRHTRFDCDWSSDVCSSDLNSPLMPAAFVNENFRFYGTILRGTPELRPRWKRCVDRKSTRLNSSHSQISYAVFCLKKKKKNTHKYRYSLLHMLLYSTHFSRD